MDIQTSLICVGVVVVSAAFVYLTSVLGMKEKTYEEALEEQRMRNNLDPILKPTKSEKLKEKKKDKSKKVGKKAKEKEAAPPLEKDMVQPKGGVPDEEDKRPQVPLPSEEESVAEQAHGHHHHHNHPRHEHVEFKEEDTIVLDVEVDKLRMRKMSTGLEKPSRPILVHKQPGNSKEANHELPLYREGGKSRRGNSFEQVHPKDDFEMMKQKEERKKSLIPTEIIIDKQTKSTNKQAVNGNGKQVGPKAIPTEPLAPELKESSMDALDNVLKFDVREVNSEPNEEREETVASPSRRAKKSKVGAASASESNASDLTPKQVVEVVKTLPLSNEEIQLLINVLLNRQGDGSTEWTKKNDPVAVLKKQLQEREQELDKENKNLEALLARTRELRQELAQEKSKQTSVSLKANQQQVELQALQTRLQQVYEQHRNELKTMQNKMQSKIIDERNVAIQRAQEENARLQQALQQLESERSNLDAMSHIKHEHEIIVEQLRTDRQQFERRQAAMQQANEDLHRQVQQMEEHLKSLANARSKEEYSFQQQLSELTKQLQQAEVSKSALAEELQQTCNQCNSLEGDNHSLKRKLDQFQGEKADDINQLHTKVSDLTKEKTSLEEALRSEQQVRSNAQKYENGQVEAAKSQELEAMQAELGHCKNDLLNLKNEIETQKQKIDELKDKNHKAIEALHEAEKSGDEKVAAAVREAGEKLKSELHVAQEEKGDIEGRLRAIESERQFLEKEKSRLISCLQRVLPDLKDNENVVNAVEAGINQLIKRDATQESTGSQELDGLKERLSQERERSEKLESQLENYKKTLSETDKLLKELESKVENEQNTWESKTSHLEGECRRLREEKEKLVSEKKELETSIQQLQGLRETIAEMEQKLKELQAKLQGEENEKKLLEAKYDEVSRLRTVNSKVCSLKEELEKNSRDAAEISAEQAEVQRMTSEWDQLKSDLEKEKKTAKELHSQNVRLNALVKIGQDSLNAELAKVNELQEQLRLRNGSVPSPCLEPTSNGSPKALKVTNSTASIDSTEEGNEKNIKSLIKGCFK